MTVTRDDKAARARTSPTVFTGSCLCGAVKFESRADARATVHCYCTDCRKTSGTGHSTHVAVPIEALAVAGEVTFYERAADSGNVISRGFCGTCGAPVYSKNSGLRHLVFVRASVLDDPDAVGPQMNVFTGQAPAWDVMDPKIPAFDRMPEH